jgi:hypothetical protein
MRVAAHPWGAAHQLPAQLGLVTDAANEPGWSSAEPILTRQQAAPYLACDSAGPDALPGCEKESENSRRLALISALATRATQNSHGGFADVATSCLGGEFARAVQEHLSGNAIGRLYAPNVIDEWTQEVTNEADRARGERRVELYWNVSTWNPYQVVLFKSQLTTRGLASNSLSVL